MRRLPDRLIALVTPRVATDFAPPPVAVAPGLWSLERRLRMPGGVSLPSRTTIVRLPSRGLLVVAPPPVAAGGLEAVEALGPVDEVLIPNSFHHLYAAAFLARHPGATLRVPPGLAARVPGAPRGEELSAATPPPWRDVVDHLVLGPVHGVAEVALFHRPSATLILTDLAFHLRTFGSSFERLAWRLSGVPAGFGPSRTARMLLLGDRAIAEPFLHRVLEWPFARVLVAHGDPLTSDAHAVFRRAFAAALRIPLRAGVV